jgi:hypothetical protein
LSGCSSWVPSTFWALAFTHQGYESDCNTKVDQELTSLRYPSDGFRIASILSVQVIRSFTCLSLQQVLYITELWSALFASHEDPKHFAPLATSCRPESIMIMFMAEKGLRPEDSGFRDMLWLKVVVLALDLAKSLCYNRI